MCPVCRQPMAAFELEGVEIDRCVGCGGTWLDAGELETIAELAGVASEEMGEALAGSTHGGRSTRRCPRCRRKLREILFGKQHAVPIERCPWGHGLWFDRGEMQAVIRSFADGEEGIVGRFFADLFHSEYESKEGGA